MNRASTLVGTGLAAAGLATFAATATATATASAASARHVSRMSSAALARAARQALRDVRIDSPGGLRVVGTHRTATMTNVDSLNWSGYADTESGGRTFSAVSSHWTQPGISCPSMELQLAAFWVGLDGANSDTVEQDGTLAECFQGRAYYYTWWEMYPSNGVQFVGRTVKAGDHIAASVVRSGTGYTLKVTDSTTSGNNVSERATCSICKNTSAEWISEATGTPRGEAPIADFRKWAPFAVAVRSGSTTGRISSFPSWKITMAGDAGYPLARPGSPTSAGSAFTVTWADSY
jgi:hypothetical protein